MKKTLGCIRRACQDFGMIEPGDRIAVGVSGGKDSLLLLYALTLYRMFSKVPYELTAITLTMGFEPFDLGGIRALCEQLGVPYVVRETRIGRVVFEERKEKNPCALCATMRRGALNREAVKLGMNKVALGHHREDVLETFLLSLLFEGRLHTFQPVTHLTRSGLTVIRPMVYLPEKHIIGMARKLDLPVVASPCPANGLTKRHEMKQLIAELAVRYPEVQQRMLSALTNTAQYGLWDTAMAGARDSDEE